jgi:hypothetical protein
MKPLSLLLVVLTIAVACVSIHAQENNTILCQVCSEPNQMKNNYCTSCGAKLALVKVAEREEAPQSYKQPVRLFSLPMAVALSESYVTFAFGNDFGMQVGESFLGTVAIGVGEVGEIELSTSGLVTSLVKNSAGFRTAGMKIQVFAGHGDLPAVGFSLRSSNDWEREERSEIVLATSDRAAFDVGLRSLNLESRITTLALFVSKQVRPHTTLHAGIGFSDVRYRNVYAGFVYPHSSVYDNSERRANQWQAFGGTSIAMNDRTTVMGEIQTLPLFKYDVNRGTVRLSRMYVGAAGFRFSLSPSWSLDSGVRYQNNFIGLADVQFRVSVNAVFLLR